MPSFPTVYLPLTTTFTAPAQCGNTPYLVLKTSTAWFKAGGDEVASCFPPAFPFSSIAIIYSPGICPAGWRSACQQLQTRSGTVENVVSCCPSSYECVASTTSLHNWETRNGCVSAFPIQSQLWPNLKPDMPVLASIYQQHIMIVESTTTSTAPSSATTQPSPASGVIGFSTPTSNSSSPPASNSSSNSSLSKGAVAGIAVGSVVGMALILLLTYIAWMIRRRNQAERSGTPLVAPESEQPTYSPDVPPGYIPEYGLTSQNRAPIEMSDTQQVYELKSEGQQLHELPDFRSAWSRTGILSMKAAQY